MCFLSRQSNVKCARLQEILEYFTNMWQPEYLGVLLRMEFIRLYTRWQNQQIICLDQAWVNFYKRL